MPGYGDVLGKIEHIVAESGEDMESREKLADEVGSFFTHCRIVANGSYWVATTSWS